MSSSSEFSRELQGYLIDFTAHSYRGYAIAQEVLKLLIQEGVIKPDDDYFAVKSNGKLMDSLSIYLAKGLSQDVRTSKYGCGVVSDFQLYFAMTEEKNCKLILKQLRFDFNDTEKYDKIRNDAKYIKAFITRTKNNLIANFELDSSPTKKSTPKKKKAPKTINTPEEALEKATEGFKQVADEKQREIDSVASQDKGFKQVADEKQREIDSVASRDTGLESLNSNGEVAVHIEKVLFKLNLKFYHLFIIFLFNLQVHRERKKSRMEMTSNPLNEALDHENLDVLTNDFYKVKEQLRSCFSQFNDGQALILKWDKDEQLLYVTVTVDDEWLEWEETVHVDVSNNTVVNAKHRLENPISYPPTRRNPRRVIVHESDGEDESAKNTPDFRKLVGDNPDYDDDEKDDMAVDNDGEDDMALDDNGEVDFN
jgi:hypothetical protein